MSDMFHQFGISWPILLAQAVSFVMLIVALIVLPVRATFASLKAYTGVELPLWILICWLLPVVGPVVTLSAIRQRREPGSDSREIEFPPAS